MRRGRLRLRATETERARFPNKGGMAAAFQLGLKTRLSCVFGNEMLLVHESASQRSAGSRSRQSFGDPAFVETLQGIV